MALQNSRVQETAAAVADVSNQMASLLATINQCLEYNSDQAIDWASGSTPEYITEEQNGNLQGKAYSRQDVANAIGSLALIRGVLQNQNLSNLNGSWPDVQLGDHLGNLNKLTRPLG